MAHKYLVDLTETEQAYLLKLIQKGKPSARQVARAQVLLHAAEGATDDAIAQALHVGVSTVHRTRQRFVDEGLVQGDAGSGKGAENVGKLRTPANVRRCGSRHRRKPVALSESQMREIRMSGSMSRMWKRGYAWTIKAPPNERGGQQLRLG